MPSQVQDESIITWKELVPLQCKANCFSENVHKIFYIALKLVVVFEFFDLEFEAIGNVGALVSFVELIKGCS